MHALFLQYRSPYPNGLLPLFVRRHEFHLQNENAVLWWFLAWFPGVDCCSADGAVLLVACVECRVEAFGAE